MIFYNYLCINKKGKDMETFIGHCRIKERQQAWRFFEETQKYYPGYKIKDFKFMTAEEYCKKVHHVSGEMSHGTIIEVTLVKDI